MHTQSLTKDQRGALETFAERHGGQRAPGWREALVMAWMNCDEPADLKSALRQVRNAFGPTWLMDEYAWGWLPEPGKWEHATFGAKGAEEASPGAVRWSRGDKANPPAVGVTVRVGSHGEATVTGYFHEAGWLGIVVRLHAPTRDDLKLDPLVHAFGPEFEPA